MNSDTDVYIGFLLYDAARKNNPEFYVTDLRLIKENDDKNLITPISYLDWYEAGDTYTRITNYTSSSRQLKAKFINAGLTDKSGNGGAPDGELDIRDLVAIHKAQMPSAISEETGIYTYTDDNAFGYDLTETRLALLNGVNIPENKPVEKFS